MHPLQGLFYEPWWIIYPKGVQEKVSSFGNLAIPILLGKSWHAAPKWSLPEARCNQKHCHFNSLHIMCSANSIEIMFDFEKLCSALQCVMRSKAGVGRSDCSGNAERASLRLENIRSLFLPAIICFPPVFPRSQSDDGAPPPL